MFKFNFYMYIMCLLCLFFSFSTCCLCERSYVFADDEQDFYGQVDETINSFDYSSLDEILNSLSENSKSIFGNSNFSGKIYSIINGDFSVDANTLTTAYLNLIFENIVEFLPILCIIIAIAILCSFVGQLQGKLGGKSLSGIINFVCYGFIIGVVATLIFQVVQSTSETVTMIKSQMEIIFPILLTLIASIGGSVSVGVYQPLIVILSTGIIQIFTSIVIPIFIVTIVFIIAQNISKNIHFSKFINFFNSSFKWLLGTIFTLFFAFLTISGIVSNTYDGITIRTAKFTMKSYIPFVGGYLSDGLDLILSSCVLVKNVVGATGLFLLLATIAVPIIKILILTFGLKLTSAILEPVSDSQISSFLFSVSKAFNMLMASVLVVAFMYLLCVGVLMCSCNIF